MRGAGEQFTVGERVAFYRLRRGLTQRVLAGLVGRSEDWLSKIERGERDIRRLDVIAELARALRVTVSDLLGQPVLLEDDKQTDDDVPAIRDALMSHRRLSRLLFEPVDTDPVPVAPVARLTEVVWGHYQDGRIGAVITALPGLIRSAQQLEETHTGTAQPDAALSRTSRCPCPASRRPLRRRTQPGRHRRELATDSDGRG